MLSGLNLVWLCPIIYWVKVLQVLTQWTDAGSVFHKTYTLTDGPKYFSMAETKLSIAGYKIQWKQSQNEICCISYNK